MSTNRILQHGSISSILVALCVAGMSGPARADHGRGEHFLQMNLVSDIPGLALLHDPDLVNAWGISFGATTPFWISDNGTGKSTLYAVTYDAAGLVHVAKQGLFVNIPGDGTPSGQVFNGTSAFNGDLFIFVSEDGTISGWRPALGTAPGTSAEVLVPGSKASVYKGVTIANTSKGPMLLAANFRKARIDAWDSSMTMSHFSDDTAPAGYAPFNVLSVAGTVLVTYAKQDDKLHDDVAGPGNGLIDIFDPETGTFTRFATGSDAGGHLRDINSPWGLALAPQSFGRLAGKLLVGNFGSGTIMAFDPPSGKFLGLLKASRGGPVTIDGLWALTFGNDGGKAGRSGTLYFTAGPNSEGDGLFGSLDPVTEDDDGGSDD